MADLVLARAGATSLAETAAFALPSVLIPYPFAADRHQDANAEVFRKAGAAWVLSQDEVKVNRLVRRIADILLQPERRARMARAAYGLAKPEASREVVDHLERLASGPGAQKHSVSKATPGRSEVA
jgi:UDP-N-acetylglucosamine--N-acetylmuramyl-(pentapeptide) pyrophosphoryl-undecaprenol N-acetylglucosamine transferase